MYLDWYEVTLLTCLFLYVLWQSQNTSDTLMFAQEDISELKIEAGLLEQQVAHLQLVLQLRNKDLEKAMKELEK